MVQPINNVFNGTRSTLLTIPFKFCATQDHLEWGEKTDEAPQWLWGRGCCGEGNGTLLRALAWKIPWTEEPGGLQSMGLLRVGHNWATSLSLFTFMHWRRKWPIYFKFKIFFYTFTKALGQRFDIFSSRSPRFIISINHCCSLEFLLQWFSQNQPYHLLSTSSKMSYSYLWLHCNSCYILIFLNPVCP